MAKDKNLTWTNVDADTLTGELKKRHDALRKTFEATKVAKDHFAEEFIKQYEAKFGKLPEGKTLKFSFLRGMAVAIVDKAGERKALSLAA